MYRTCCKEHRSSTVSYAPPPRYGNTMIPLYDTLGPANITYCLKHSGLTTCFATGPSVAQLAKTPDLAALSTIVTIGNEVKEEDQISLEKKGIRFITWQNILAMGRESI